MPIEIRELIIKVIVQEPAASGLAPAGPLAGEELRQWQQQLTRACVQQVLAELQRRRER